MLYIRKNKSKIVDIAELYTSDKNPFYQYLTTAPFAKYHKHPSEDHSLPVFPGGSEIKLRDEYGNSINEWKHFFNLKLVEKINYNFLKLKEFGFKGPAGDKGPRGDVGADGPKGEKGDVGDKGETGDLGGESYLVWAMTKGKDGTNAIYPRYFKNELNPKIRRVVFGDVGDILENTYSPSFFKADDDIEDLTRKMRGASLYVFTKNPTSRDEIIAGKSTGFLQFVTHGNAKKPANTVANVALFKRTDKSTFNLFFRGFALNDKNSYSPYETGEIGLFSEPDLNFNDNIRLTGESPVLSEYYKPTGFNLGNAAHYSRLAIGKVDGIQSTYSDINFKKSNQVFFQNNPQTKNTEFATDFINSNYNALKINKEEVIFNITNATNNAPMNNIIFGDANDNRIYQTDGTGLKSDYSVIANTYGTDFVIKEAETPGNEKFDFKVAYAKSKHNYDYHTEKYIDVGFTKWNGLFQRFPIGTILAISYKEWIEHFKGGNNNGNYGWPKNGLPFETDLGAGLNGYKGWYLANGQIWRLGNLEYTLPRLNEFYYKLEDGSISINTNQLGDRPVLLGNAKINMRLNPNNTMTNEILGNTKETKIQFDDDNKNAREDSPVWIVYLEQEGFKWKTDGDDISSLNDIVLSYHLTEAPITCSLLNTKTYKTNLPNDTTTSFNNIGADSPINKMSKLYIQEGTKFKIAPAGWYSTGNIIRYFDGVEFVQAGAFAPKKCTDVGLTEITIYKARYHWLLNKELLSKDNKSLLNLEQRTTLPDTDITKVTKVTAYAPNANVFTGTNFGEIGALELFADKYNKSLKLSDGWYRYGEYIFKMKNGAIDKAQTGQAVIHKVDNLYPLGFEPATNTDINLSIETFENIIFSDNRFLNGFSQVTPSYIFDASKVDVCSTFNSTPSATNPAYYGFVELIEPIKPGTQIKNGAKFMYDNFGRVFIYENTITSKSTGSDGVNAGSGVIVPLKTGPKYIFANNGSEFKIMPYNRKNRGGFLPKMKYNPYNKIFFKAADNRGYIADNLGNINKVTVGCPVSRVTDIFYVPRLNNYKLVRKADGTYYDGKYRNYNEFIKLLPISFRGGYGFNAIDYKSVFETGYFNKIYDMPEKIFDIVKENLYWTETNKHIKASSIKTSLGYGNCGHIKRDRCKDENFHLNPIFRDRAYDTGQWQFTSHTFRITREGNEALNVKFRTNHKIHKYDEAKPHEGALGAVMYARIFDKNGNRAKSTFTKPTQVNVGDFTKQIEVKVDVVDNKLMVHTGAWKQKKTETAKYKAVDFSINFDRSEDEIYVVFIYNMNGRTHTKNVFTINIEYTNGTNSWFNLHNDFQTSVNNDDVMNFHNNQNSYFTVSPSTILPS